MSDGVARATIARIAAQLEAAGEGEAATDALVTWHEQHPAPLADGTIPFSPPYPRYRFDTGATWCAVDALGYLRHANYVGWLEAFGPGRLTAETIAGLGSADLAMTLLYFSRGERFCDGWQAGLIADGRLRAALARLLVLTKDPARDSASASPPAPA